MPLAVVSLSHQGTIVVSLTRLRLDCGLSQEELAEKAGISRSTLHAIEQGERPPYPSTRRKIAEALGVPIPQIDWPEARAITDDV